MATVERQEVRAVAKWVRMSPRKARLVVEHIRGRSVPEARTVLAFTQRAAAREIEKVLSSAVANAEANHNLVGDDLVVSAAYVDEGPVMKRWRARARGRRRASAQDHGRDRLEEGRGGYNTQIVWDRHRAQCHPRQRFAGECREGDRVFL